MSDNVIQFCSIKHEKHTPPSENDLIVDGAVGKVLQHLDERGYNIYNEKDIGLICEAINSALRRIENKKHSLQELADKIIVVT